MRIKLLSDLHLEFSKGRFDHIFEPSDLDKETTLVLAGDIHVGTMAEEFINEMCKHFKYVVRVLGNHEFYHNEFYDVITRWNEIENNSPANFHFLNNDVRIIDGVRFIGGTMWTSLGNSDPMVMLPISLRLNDYVEIKVDGQKLTPEFVIEQHNIFMKFLTEEFSKEFDGKTVVVTHHSPGDQGRRVYSSGSVIHYAYYARLEEFIEQQNKCVLWCHGHTHRSADYLVGNTRIVCNPYGYYNHHTNGSFNKDLIIEI